MDAATAPSLLSARRTRATVVRLAIALGTAPWLVAAGIVEGNRARLAEAGLGTDLLVGVALGALFWTLVVWRGARRA